MLTSKGHLIISGMRPWCRPLATFPARELIKQWLKAGYVEEEMRHPTDTGVPQGGVISPLLLNVALAWHGARPRDLVYPQRRAPWAICLGEICR